MTDATGTTTWDYNAAGEVEELDTPQGTIEYTYNLAGQRATMVEPAGTTTYTYDAAGRLDEIEDFNTDVTSYTYDAAGRISRRDLPNGTYETFAYDARSRVTDILTKNSSNATLASRGYVYDAVSQVTQVVEGAVTTDYDYDLAGQLIEEDKSTGYLANYTYDANGNRLTRTVNSVTETYSYDNGDKLTAITGGSDPRTYAYDAAGRTTAITRSGVATTFVYDFESRVTSISRTGLTTNTFEYNALDTRVEEVDSSGTATYLRDGVGVTAPVLSDGSANYTPSGEDRSGVKTTFHSGLKNADSQTNASQAVSAARLYDAFGNVLSSSGTWKSPFGTAGRFGYQEDADYGLKLLGHRYYDSSTGRFLTRDQRKDGRNWYVYCDNCPVRRGDPNGEKWHDPVWVAVDPEFKGSVIAYGDFEFRAGDYWRKKEIMPGYASDSRMDVDLIVILDEQGNVIDEWWLPGKNYNPWDSEEQSGYYVDAHGKVHAKDGAMPVTTRDEVARNTGLFGSAGGALLAEKFKRDWQAWIDEANNPATGFPLGYEPKPYSGGMPSPGRPK